MVDRMMIAQIKAATNPKNWIRDPAGSDPDPDSLVRAIEETPLTGDKK